MKEFLKDWIKLFKLVSFATIMSSILYGVLYIGYILIAPIDTFLKFIVSIIILVLIITTFLLVLVKLADKFISKI